MKDEREIKVWSEKQRKGARVTGKGKDRSRGRESNGKRDSKGLRN